jgi:hypothetical protein
MKLECDKGPFYPEDIQWRKTETSALQCPQTSGNTAVLLPPRQDAGDEYKNP